MTNSLPKDVSSFPDSCDGAPTNLSTIVSTTNLRPTDRNTNCTPDELRTVRGYLWRCLHRTWQIDDFDDLVQSAWLQGTHYFMPDRGMKRTTFVIKVGLQLASKLAKRAHMKVDHEMDWVCHKRPDASHIVDASDWWEEAKKQLTYIEKYLLHLRFVEELTCREISDIVGWSHQWVRNTIINVQRRLSNE